MGRPASPYNSAVVLSFSEPINPNRVSTVERGTKIPSQVLFS
jgi:hypothetical protein